MVKYSALDATEALGSGEGTDEGASDTSTDSGKKDNNAKANIEDIIMNNFSGEKLQNYMAKKAAKKLFVLSFFLL